MKNRPVFVYGTLKEGGRLASSFDHRRIAVTKATVKGIMMDINGGFPACRFGNWRHSVNIQGELHSYERHLDVIEHLDRIEGYRGEGHRDNMYNRILITVTTETGDKIEAWAYEWNGDLDWHKMKSGNWKN